MPDLHIRGLLLLDGQPVACTSCGSRADLSLDQCGPRETWPALLNCGTCGHGEDHPVITNGLVEAAVESRTGRKTAEDRDVFAGEWRGHVLQGECVPELVAADLTALGDELRKIGVQEIRERKQEARKWWRGYKKAGRRAVGQAVGGAKAAALRTAWDLQTGGAGPEQRPRTRCRTKGCRGGWVTITSRIQAPGERAEKVQVPCGACHRA
jgi:hypothetical protein